MNACRSCDAPIQWAKTLNGKAMPLDVEPIDPNERGAMVVWREDGQLRCAGIREAARSVAYIEKVSEQRARSLIESGDYSAYLSHFATCPNGPQHRRGRR